MDNMLGRVLGNRYEVIEKIGDGGMALVYKGRDRLLNRFVAIKMLRNEFSVNDDFLNKFDKEAQASAGLSHPNIVNIYDVGNDEGTNFIVMEYIDGITLKEFIRTKRTMLREFDIVSIGRQIADALSHAHKNHIIHRDIKSQNILITDNYHVKVADFGIARALTTATLTATKEIMGSVHYSSPEQARGSYVDERSDIYSLGVVLYEMVTGVLPFDGETPVAVALQHMKEDIVPPSDYNPSLSIGLESIIYKALMKSPQERFQSATEMSNDLGVLIQNPSAIFNYFNTNMAESPTMVLPSDDRLSGEAAMGSAGLKQDTAQEYLDEPNMHEEVDQPDKTYLREVHPDDSRFGYGDEDRVWHTPKLEVDEKPKKAKKERKAGKGRRPLSSIARKDVIIPVVGGILFAVAVLFLGLKFASGTLFDTGSKVEVPNVVNMTYEDAQKAIEEKGLSVTMSDSQYSDQVQLGYVISQDVAAGSKVAEKSLISLVISKGPEKPSVPDVIGKQYEEAKSIITNAGFTVGTVSYAKSDEATGVVIEQSPKSLSGADPGSSISLKVSEGKAAEIQVPKITGKSVNSAKSLLSAVSLSIGSVTYDYSSQYQSGLIMMQSISAGTKVSESTSIDVVVSKGPKETSSTKSIEVPFDTASADSFTLKVVKSVNGADTVVYQKKHSKSEGSTTVSVTSSGTTTIKFYFDNELQNTMTEDF